jgi:hypothetical protein
VGGDARIGGKEQPARFVARRVGHCSDSSEVTAAGDGYFEYGVLDRA